MKMEYKSSKPTDIHNTQKWYKKVFKSIPLCTGGGGACAIPEVHKCCIWVDQYLTLKKVIQDPSMTAASWDRGLNRRGIGDVQYRNTQYITSVLDKSLSS